MDDNRLREIEDRHREATPGPYHVHNYEGEYGTLYLVCSPEGEELTGDISPSKEDAEFFAHAWQDVRDLHDEVLRLRKLLIDYGGHDDGCSALFDEAYRCRCGWREVQAELLGQQGLAGAGLKGVLEPGHHGDDAGHGGGDQ